VFALVRPGDEHSRQFALKLGAQWADSSDEMPPVPLDAALIFAPVGALMSPTNLLQHFAGEIRQA
jgi:alcohol dehydrogenase, propanol-preferring